MSKTVNICGIPYQIIDKECIEDNGRVCGEITYDECIIKMREGMHPDYYNFIYNVNQEIN